MKIANYSEFRQNLKTYLDMSYQNHETLVVTRKNNQNMVILSQEDYDSMAETVYLLSSEKNTKRLLESKNQSAQGEKVDFDLSRLSE